MKSFYKKISLISFITFICGIIIFLPAKVSNEWFLPNSIKFYGTKGTLWRGSAQEGLVSKIYIEKPKFYCNYLTLNKKKSKASFVLETEKDF